LELAGDERIQEYPPRGLTGYETLVEGHGVFKASASSDLGLSYTNPYDAFSKAVSVWITADNSYSSGLATNVNTFQGVNGAWLKLKLPYKINLKRFKIQGRNGSNERFIDAILYASTDDNNWDQLRSIEMPASYDYATGVDFDAPNTSKYYNYFLIQITKVQTGAGQANYANIGEWRLFGTPGPTTLDKGSLTLGRSLDVPRVSRYDVDTETPRPEKLVVDFDTTVNSTPTDISGKGNHGAFYGVSSYSPADKAFSLSDGTTSGQIAAGPITVPAGAGVFIHSISFWGWVSEWNVPFFYMDDTYLASGNTNTTAHCVLDGAGLLRYDFWSNAIQVQDGNTFPKRQWVHVGLVYKGGAVTSTSVEIYYNGVKQAVNTASNAAYTSPSSVYLQLGSTNTLHIKISNFKLYDTVLEPSEVKKLYNLGRTGRSMVISDTAVGIGKVPEAQLDVRGDILGGCPAFFNAYRDAGNTSGAVNPLIWNQVTINKGGGYDNVTGKFTASVSGYYRFDVYLSIENPGGSISLQWQKNDVDLTQKMYGWANVINHMNVAGNITIYLLSGDTFHVRQTDGAMAADNAGDGQSYTNGFSGFYLSS
jgi:hypothetical protein